MPGLKGALRSMFKRSDKSPTDQPPLSTPKTSKQYPTIPLSAATPSSPPLPPPKEPRPSARPPVLPPIVPSKDKLGPESPVETERKIPPTQPVAAGQMREDGERRTSDTQSEVEKDRDEGLTKHDTKTSRSVPSSQADTGLPKPLRIFNPETKNNTAQTEELRTEQANGHATSHEREDTADLVPAPLSIRSNKSNSSRPSEDNERRSSLRSKSSDSTNPPSRKLHPANPAPVIEPSTTKDLAPSHEPPTAPSAHSDPTSAADAAGATSTPPPTPPITTIPNGDTKPAGLGIHTIESKPVSDDKTPAVEGTLEVKRPSLIHGMSATSGPLEDFPEFGFAY